MKYIRTKFMILIFIMLTASVLITGVISVNAIKHLGDESSAEKLSMLCETTQKNLNDWLSDLKESVDTVYQFAESELYSLEYEDLAVNELLIQRLCRSIAENNTQGVVSYYYRIAPEVAKDTLGFWYIKDFSSGNYYMSPLTDLGSYDPDDLGHLGWYTIPRQAGVPVWLGPYVNENMHQEIISYVAPVSFGKNFVGVIGMDLKASTLTDLVADIRVYQTGYAFLLDQDNNLVFLPDRAEDTALRDLSPEILSAENQVHSYSSNGTDMRIVWRYLSNGMKIFVTAPDSEINATWVALIRNIAIAALILLIICAFAVIVFSIGLTRPLQRLTDAAVEVNKGNYDVKLETRSKDEVGILTNTFRKLIDYLRDYIGDLNEKVYSDALTSLQNKGAFNKLCQEIQKKTEDQNREEPLQYAIVMLDCNNLKTINDVYGHEKGDVYLKKASSLICNVFAHSPVFRVGGDEFTVVLQGQDYENREALFARFEMDEESINAMCNNPWDEIHVAYGLGVYDPAVDKEIDSVIKRADQNMYQKKKAMKVQAGR